MADKVKRKASITITPMSTAKQVREELCRATGQQVWSDNQYWSFYLKGRREIFDYIYDEIPDKDWQNPATSQLVEQKFVALAYERWGRPEDVWVLDGDWMVSRPDILSWMRTIYWKHNKPRRLRLREEHRDPGAWRPYQVSMASASEGIPAVGTASSAQGGVDTIGVAGRPESSGGSSNHSNWKDVMLG